MLRNPLLIETTHANRIPVHIRQKFRRVKHIEREIEIVKLVKGDGYNKFIFVCYNF